MTSDADKLRILAAWFDMWDAANVERRQRILIEDASPARNDVQRDLRRMADRMDGGGSRRFLGLPARFWKLRLSTLLWGFLVSLVFTGSLITSAAMWTVVVAGNTYLMWRWGR